MNNNVKKAVIESIKKELGNKPFSTDDFYDIAGVGMRATISFNEFEENVPLREIEDVSIKEITLDKLCAIASKEGGEEYYYENTYEYYVENGKIYQKIIFEGKYQII